MRQAAFTQLSLEFPSVEAERPSSGPAPKSGLGSLAGKASLTLGEAARIMRDAVRDKSYRATPLGQLVGRYIRWFRNEWGATPETIRDYELTLAKMALFLSDKEPLDVMIDDLREALDHYWSDGAARTRQKNTSIIRAFWAWAEEEGYVPLSPAHRMRRPRAPKPTAPLLPANTDAKLLNVVKRPRDRVALLILLDCGVRRSELTGIRVRDIDMSRRTLTVHGKGQKSRVIPLRGRVVLELEQYLLTTLDKIDRTPEPDDYLLYPEYNRRVGKENCVVGGDPKKRMVQNVVHRWWYRMLAEAGLVSEGVTSGLNMHLARHTFAQQFRRAVSLDHASHALGHADLSTTSGIYGHYDESDLEAAFDQYAQWLREKDSSRNPEDLA